MTNGNRLLQPTSPAGSCQPSAQPAHLRRQRHAAGQQEQGQTAARSSPRPYRQRGRPAGEQERRSRSGAGAEQASRRQSRNSPTQPHHQPPTPASRPTTPSRRPCSRSNPTQPQRPERSRERVQRRGGGEGERGAARPSVQISRPGHNMPNTPPNRPGQTAPERSSPSATREQPEPPAVLRWSSAFGENAEPATPQPPKSDGRQPHPAAVAPPDRGSLDISATPAHLR